MSQQTYDPCGKWLLEKRGAAMLWVAGIRKVLSCRTTQAEVVHPRKLPDGLLDAVVAGRPEPLLMLVEVATYPEVRVAAQMADGLRLVRQARGVLPDGIVLCLSPKGSFRIPDRASASSALGLSSEGFSWKVVNLWEVPAEELLEAPDVGAVPWAALGRYDGPPEVLLQRCKDRIDREGGDLTDGLLAVSQVFARLHFNRPNLISILGGKKMLMDTPLIQEIVEETRCEERVKSILDLLTIRFGVPGDRIGAGLKQVPRSNRLAILFGTAATCVDLAAFEAALAAELPRPRPASTRARRKPKKAE